MKRPKFGAFPVDLSNYIRITTKVNMVCTILGQRPSGLIHNEILRAKPELLIYTQLKRMQTTY